MVKPAKDANQHNPVFSECSSYHPKIKEGDAYGISVIRVQATDADEGVNGQITYSIVEQPDETETKFVVHEDTGEIFTNKVNFLFDSLNH